jgi:peroxidase
MEQAIAEAKANVKAREEAKKNRVETQNEKDGKYTSTQLLAKFFKKPSSDARKKGKARLLYKEIVRGAERRLSEMRRVTVARTQGSEAKAESLAEMLFHRPGSLLTAQEVGLAWEAAGGQQFESNITCNFPTVNIFRTIDGTCNNLEKPLLGSAGTAFKRLVPPVYEDGINSLRGTLQAQKKFPTFSPFLPPNPSARLISETVILNISQDELPFTHLLMQWGQFLDHDLDLGPELEEECEECKFTEICQPIRVPDLDRSFGIGTPNNGSCLPFRRSVPVIEPEKPLTFNPEEQLNDITSFIDGSMIYGSRLEQSLAVRAFRGGLLREGIRFPGNQPSLPIDTGDLVQCPNRMDCFLCGEVRCNEQFSLTVMHTLWLREHNRCARELAKINPFWNDEKLYQVCRKIVGALIQKITFVDYLPKVLGPKNFDRFIGPYRGYFPDVDPSIPNSFATAAYRYGHSLVRPFFDRLNEEYRPLPIGPLNLVDAFFAPDQFRKGLGADPIMRGWVSTNSRRMDEFMNSVLTTQLFQTPLSPGLDLASLNMQRGRDHGLSPYLIYKNFCFEKFGITSDFENDLTLVRFLKLYGSLETLDIWIGGLAEERLSDEGLLGATFACLFGLTFKGVREGDRFFWLKPGVFTPRQRRSIAQDSIARVICDNSDGIDFIQPDAFLSNQTRVPCSRLGRVELSLFREEVCYIRTEIRPRSFPVALSVFTRTTSTEFDFMDERIRPSRNIVFRCIAVQCPTASVPTEVMFLTPEELRRRTRLVPNERFPPNIVRTPGVYRALLPLSAFEAEGEGLFRSLQACRRSSEVGLMVEVGSTAALESELEALVADSGTTEHVDYTKMNLPEEVMNILNSKNTNIKLESAESSNTGSTESPMVKGDQEETKTAALFDELEEALKSI